MSDVKPNDKGTFTLANQFAEPGNKFDKEFEENQKGQETKDTNDSVKTVLTEFPGATVDGNGNLLDSTGKVLKTKVEFDNYVKEKTTKKEGESEDSKDEENDKEEPTIELVLNKEGDLVDKEGKVVHKKDTFKYDPKTGEVTLPEEAWVPSLKEAFKSKGFSFTGKDGKELEFEDSEQGAIDLVTAMANEVLVKEQNKFFNQHPDLLALANHIRVGGDPAEFYTAKAAKVDYTKVNIAEDNKLGRENVIREYLTKVARNDADTTDMIVKAILDSGELDKRYTDYLGKLRTWQTETEAAQAKALQDQLAADAKANQDYWEKIQSITNSGKLNSLVIPEADRAAFFDFLSKDVGDGRTAAAKAYAELPPEQQLELDFFLYKGLKLDDLVKLRVQEQQVDRIKARKQGGNKIIIKSSPEFTQVGSGSDISISTIQ